MNHLLTLLLPALVNWRFRAGAISGQVRDTLRGQPPCSSADWANQAAVRDMTAGHTQLLNRPSYFGGSVLLALLVGLCLLGLALAIASGLVSLAALGATELMVYGSAAALFVLCLVALWNAFARDWGPELITHVSYAASRERLQQSLDDHVRQASVLMSLALLVVVIGDGVMAGSSILGFLRSYVTSSVAALLATAWGLIVGAGLWKLTDFAADESRRAEVRDMARQLDSSTHPADQARLGQLMTRVGTRIGLNLGAKQSITWRAALVATVLVLSVVTALIRIQAPAISTDAEPVVIASAKASEADEISLPPPPVGNAPPPGGTAAGAAPTGTIHASWLPSILMSIVLMLSAAVLYAFKRKSTFINLADGRRDAAVLTRFADEAAVRHFNELHMRKVIAALDRKLQRFSLELERAKQALAPSQQRLWPPCRLRAVDLLRTEILGSRRPINDIKEF